MESWLIHHHIVVHCSCLVAFHFVGVAALWQLFGLCERRRKQVASPVRADFERTRRRAQPGAGTGASASAAPPRMLHTKGRQSFAKSSPHLGAAAAAAAATAPTTTTLAPQGAQSRPVKSTARPGRKQRTAASCVYTSSDAAGSKRSPASGAHLLEPTFAS